MVGKVWHIHAVECYLVIKRDEVLTPAVAWMNPGETRQARKACFCSCAMSRTGKSTETESSWGVSQGWGRGEWIWDDGKVLELESGDGPMYLMPWDCAFSLG